MRDGGQRSERLDGGLASERSGANHVQRVMLYSGRPDGRTDAGSHRLCLFRPICLFPSIFSSWLLHLKKQDADSPFRCSYSCSPWPCSPPCSCSCSPPSSASAPKAHVCAWDPADVVVGHPWPGLERAKAPTWRATCWCFEQAPASKIIIDVR